MLYVTRWLYCLWIVLMWHVLLWGVHKTTLIDNASFREPALRVRVLLDAQRGHHAPEWPLYAASGFVLQDADHPHRQQRWTTPHVTITCDGHVLRVNNKRVSAKRLYIFPQGSDPLYHNGCAYAGGISVSHHGKYGYLVNVIDVEEYVYSVLRWEGWPGWPDEVYKAFAVMCRTYVVDKVWSHRKMRYQLPYDIKNSNIHQTYKGLHSFPRLRSAVEATQGLILTYKGKPIVAMYDACCGGVIPAHVTGFDFRKAPYLARTYPCTFCQSTPLYTWRKQYDLATFRDMLRKHAHIPEVHDIAVSKRDEGEVVQSVRVYGSHTSTSISADQLYAACKDLRSLCFSVGKHGETIIFDGYGFGHHIGLCQWGAREMVRQGWDYESILRFFYPSVAFMRLRVTHKEA